MKKTVNALEGFDIKDNSKLMVATPPEAPNANDGVGVCNINYAPESITVDTPMNIQNIESVCELKNVIDGYGGTADTKLLIKPEVGDTVFVIGIDQSKVYTFELDSTMINNMNVNIKLPDYIHPDRGTAIANYPSRIYLFRHSVNFNGSKAVVSKYTTRNVKVSIVNDSNLKDIILGDTRWFNSEPTVIDMTPTKEGLKITPLSSTPTLNVLIGKLPAKPNNANGALPVSKILNYSGYKGILKFDDHGTDITSVYYISNKPNTIENIDLMIPGIEVTTTYEPVSLTATAINAEFILNVKGSIFTSLTALVTKGV